MTDASLTPPAALLLVVMGGILAIGAARAVHSAGAISIAPVKIAYEIPALAAHADSEPLFPGQPVQSPTPQP
ncbi:MAG TPA: hypothetical protein VIM48_01980 [Chthoniobacterales bacterium]